MIRLRKILLSRTIYFIILFCAFLYAFSYLTIFKCKSNININDNAFVGVIKDINISDNLVKLKMRIKNEYIIGYYKTKIFTYEVGDKIIIKGKVEKPSNNTVFNLFNYKKYLYYQKTFYIIRINNIKLVSKNKNIFLKIKNSIEHNINKRKTHTYLKLFILGNKRDLSSSVYKIYQNNGISHLFCVSGMHVSFLSGFILKLLKRIRVKEKNRYILVFLFLGFYLFLTNYSPSILRSIVFFILLSINKIHYFYIKPINLLLLTLSVCIFINPNFLFSIGFIFSFVITFYLVLFNKYLTTKNKIKNLFLVSFISFIASFPICIYNLKSFFQAVLVCMIRNYTIIIFFDFSYYLAFYFTDCF